jgi:hypothetical protein
MSWAMYSTTPFLLHFAITVFVVSDNTDCAYITLMNRECGGMLDAEAGPHCRQVVAALS